MDTSDRSRHRAVWLIVAIVLALVVGLVGYELNWIHQRQAAWARSWVWLAHGWSWTDLYSQSEHLPARGLGPVDRLVMRLLNERERDFFLVDYPDSEPDPLPTDDVLEELAEVRHAHWLFPEATIIVEYPVRPSATSSQPGPAPPPATH